MASLVIQFPGAAAAPVVNPKRRGRLPRGVHSLESARWARKRQEQEAKAERCRAAHAATAPDADVIAVTRALLDLAQRGELRGLAGIYNCVGHDVEHAVVGDLGPDNEQITQEGMRVLWWLTGPKDGE